jgi:hypothetical protein
MTAFVSTVTVTLVTQGSPTGQDQYGNDTYTPVETTVPGCLFAPGGSTETVNGQDVVVTQPTVYAPTGTPVTAYDKAIVTGYGTFDVDGKPQAWPPSPFSGWQPRNSVVIRLREVQG